MDNYPTIDYETTGKHIKFLCRQRGLSVSDLQKNLFIGSNQAIYNWFNGKSLPSLDTFYALSILLKVPLDDILIPK